METKTRVTDRFKSLAANRATINERLAYSKMISPPNGINNSFIFILQLMLALCIEPIAIGIIAVLYSRAIRVRAAIAVQLRLHFASLSLVVVAWSVLCIDNLTCALSSGQRFR